MKKSKEVKVLQLIDNRRLDFSIGRGVLLGKKGDWIVEYEDGQLSVVGEQQYNSFYEVIR